jgi:hypothetical protein
MGEAGAKCVQFCAQVAPKFSSVAFAASPLWSNVTAIKQRIGIGNGGTEELLVTEPVWNICSRVNKCSTEMVHTDVERSPTIVSRWQVLALRG